MSPDGERVLSQNGIVRRLFALKISKSKRFEFPSFSRSERLPSAPSNADEPGTVQKPPKQLVIRQRAVLRQSLLDDDLMTDFSVRRHRRRKLQCPASGHRFALILKVRIFGLYPAESVKSDSIRGLEAVMMRSVNGSDGIQRILHRLYRVHRVMMRSVHRIDGIH